VADGAKPDVPERVELAKIVDRPKIGPAGRCSVL
jgi:hypothetical protein